MVYLSYSHYSVSIETAEEREKEVLFRPQKNLAIQEKQLKTNSLIMIRLREGN